MVYWTAGGGTVLQLAEELVNLRGAAQPAVTLAETVERVRLKYRDRTETDANEALRRR